MKLLLDTHVLIWALTEDERLPEETFELINDYTNDIYCSAASLWEIQIKHENHPDKVPFGAETIEDFVKELDYRMLDIAAPHVAALATLERSDELPPHKDPFDRIMIAQAKSEGMQLLTRDRRIAEYDEPCVRFV